LLYAGQFGFRARHSTAFQCVMLTDNVTLNFNNNVCGCGIHGCRKSHWHYMATWLFTQIT